MKLSEITQSVPLTRLQTDRLLAKEIQQRLCLLSCLDPPADGQFGPISTLALNEFARISKVATPEPVITPAIASKLRSHTPETFIPITPGAGLANRLVTYMQRQGFFVARLPDFLTIVYLEGSDNRGRPIPNEPDRWNDRRIVLTIGAGRRPVIVHNAEATSEPGKEPTEKQRHGRGAPRIALGQRRAWAVGIHDGPHSPPHEALKQVGVVMVCRDVNGDNEREGDVVKRTTGINQHSSLQDMPERVGNFSAGCLVARNDLDHKEFMALVKTDPRFKAARKAGKDYRFFTAVIRAKDLAAAVP